MAISAFALMLAFVAAPVAAHDASLHLDIDGEEWAGVNDLSQITVSGNYYLIDNITLEELAWEVPSGQNITLCLNGHWIKQTMSGGIVIGISTETQLNLCDCDKETKHYFDKDEEGLWILNDENTSSPYNVTGGVITGGNLYDDDFGNILNYGTFTMSGGNIVGNKASMGGGVYNSGTFIMSGGNIIGNLATRIDLEMPKCLGGGVYNSGTFIMSGGNIADNWAGMGGGVFNLGTFIMSDGSIIGNEARAGGGVYMYAGSFTLSGNVRIENNTVFGYPENVYLPDDKIILGGDLFEDACIGVTTNTQPTEDNPVEIIDSGVTPDIAEHFFADQNPSQKIECVDGKLYLSYSPEWQTWTETDSLPNVRGNYILDNDVTLSETWNAPHGKTSVDLNGHVVRLKTSSEENPVIYVGSGNELNISDSNNTKHYFDLDDETGLWILNDTNISSPYNVTGGVITGGSNGGGVYNSGTFIMSGGNIVGNTASRGGGVYNSGTFTISGGNITSNKASTYYKGGGVYVDNGIFTMSGGNITDNEASIGGGVYVGGGSFTIIEGNITNNIASAYGGGVYVDNGIFTLSGNTKVENNTKNGSPNNVHLRYGMKIILGDALVGGAKIGVTTSEDVTEERPVTIIDSGVNEDIAGHFFADVEWQDTKIIGETLCLAYSFRWQTWTETDSLPDVFGNYILDNDVTLSETWNVPTGKTKLDLNGHVVKLDASVSGQSVIYVSYRNELNISDSNKTKHYFDKNDDGLWILNDTNISSLYNVAGGVITGSSNGGGVYNSGTFIMSGGNIVGNTASINGGGVYNSGTFTISGGNITSNKASTYYNGGGVYVDNGIFTMSGGNITDNEASIGGGVYVGGGSFTIIDGNITNNIASAYGGGVYNSGTFTISGGDIDGNKAMRGGGVLVNNGGTFTIVKGNITNNTASSNGGGVEVNNRGNFIMSGGNIASNIATNDGGGVDVTSSSIFTMNWGNITNNTANDGGGVSVSDSTYTMSGGNITSNIAAGFGSGVDVYESHFTMSGNATVSIDNDIYLYQNTNITVSGNDFTGSAMNITGNTIKNGTSVVKAATASSLIEKFALHNDKLRLSANEDNTALIAIPKHEDKGITEFSEIIESGSYYLKNDIYLLDGEWTVPNGKNITLDLNGHVIIQMIDGRNAILMDNNPETKLTITDTSNRIHYFDRDEATGLWTLNDTNTSSIYTCVGGVITGVNNPRGGGGVYMYAGNFTLSGGNIIGNNAAYGGGVAVGSGNFTLVQGNISGNVVSGTGTNGNGGGVDVGDKATILGGNITYNTASNGGGGMYVSGYGSVTIVDGNIASNIANNGGGVFTYGILNITNGNITGNIALGNNGGGGVYMSSDGYHLDACKIVMSGGNISGNTAPKGDGDGNGVRVYDGEMIMSGNAVIAANNDLWLFNGKTITVDGNEFTGSAMKINGSYIINTTPVVNIAGDSSIQALTLLDKFEIANDGLWLVAADDNTLVAATKPKFAAATLSLSTDIAVRFFVNNSTLTQAHNPYVVAQFKGVETTLSPTINVTSEQHVFTFKDISPAEMNKTIVATLYATKVGDKKPVICDSLEYSVRQYCANMFKNYGDNTKLRTLCADLLNYGSAAQVYADVDAGSLVNSTMNATQKGWASKDFELQGEVKFVDGNDTVAVWRAASLNLYSDISVLFKFTTDYPDKLSKVVVTYGRDERTRNVTDFKDATYVNSSGKVENCKLLKFNQMNALDLNYPIKIKIVDASGNESDTLTYSVETYAKNKQNESEKELGTLVVSMMKYIKSVAAKFNEV